MVVGDLVQSPLAKRDRARNEGMKAWIDPVGYRRFIAEKKRAFEDQIDLELGVKRSK